MECCFCKEYADPLQSQFYSEIGKEIGCTSRILLETDNWYVIPTLGSLTSGYVLLVFKQHNLSLANVDKASFLEMLELKSLVESILFKHLGLQCVTFEHGTADPSSKGANSVDHVHIHMLPFTRPIWQDVKQDIPPASFEVLEDYDSLYDRWRNNMPRSYLLFQDVDKRIYYIPDASNMPSQLFRKCLAPYLGVKQWNWRKENYSDNIIRTIALFKKAEGE